MKKKKILSMLLAFTIACTNFSGISNFNPISIGAEVVHASSEYTESGVTYTLYDDQTAEVTGVSGTTITIPETISVTTTVDDVSETTKYTITSIKTGIFKDNTTIETLKISTTSIKIDEIEDNMFSGCKYLTSVTYPTTIEKIGVSAFANCTKLSAITIGSGVKTIEANAFEGCTALKSITLPITVEKVGANAFLGCDHLESATLPTNNYFISIPSNLFDGCTALSSITIPANVTSIGASAFKSTKLSSVTIPANVTTLDDKPFESCNSLTTVTFSGNPPTSYSSASNINGMLGVSAIVNYTSDSSTNKEWKDFITTVKPDDDSEYVNSKATALTLSISNSNNNETPLIGDVLTVEGGTNFDADNTSYTIQWYADNVAITENATSETFTVTEAQTSKTISVKVTVPTSDYYFKNDTYTAKTNQASDGKTELPQVTLEYDALVVDKDITVTAKDDDNVDVLYDVDDYTIKWSRVKGNDSEDISNDDKLYYKLTDADIGWNIKVEVTIQDDDYKTTETRVTSTSEVVTDGKDPFPDIQLDITTPYFGDTITVSSKGSVDLADNYTIEWYVSTNFNYTDDDKITDFADSTTFKVNDTAYVDKIITAVVTIYEDDDYSNVTKTAATYAVKSADVTEKSFSIIVTDTDGNEKDTAQTDDILSVQLENQPTTIALVPYTEYDITWYVGDDSVEANFDDTLTVLKEYSGKKVTAQIDMSKDSNYTDTDKILYSSIVILANLPELKFDTETPRIGTSITVSFKDSEIDTSKYTITWTRTKGSILNPDNKATIDITGWEGETITATVKAIDNDFYNDTPVSVESNEIALAILPTPVIKYEYPKMGEEITVTVTDSNDNPIDITEDDYEILWWKNPYAVVGKMNYIPILDDDGVQLENLESITLGENNDVAIGDYIVVSVQPTSSNKTYDSKIDEIYSEKTLDVLDKDGKRQLESVTIGLNTVGSQLQITDPTNLKELTFQWNVVNDDDSLTPITGEESYFYELISSDANQTFCVQVTPTADSTYSGLTVTSNEFTITDSLPTLKITSEKGIGSNGILVDDVLTLSFDDTSLDIKDYENLYVEWLVNGEATKFISTIAQDSSILNFTILEEYSTSEISVRVTNRLHINPDDNYNNIPTTLVAGKVETKVYKFTYDLDASLKFSSAPAYNAELDFGQTLTATLSLNNADAAYYSLPISASDIDITMGGTKLSTSQFSYNPATGEITIDSVTGAVHIEATAYVLQPDAGLNYPTIYLDNSMTGVTSSRYTLTDGDKNADGWYEFYLSGDTLPETIKITFGSAVPMTLIDGYLYYNDTGKVEIDPTRFGSNALGYYATISGTWSDGTTNSPNTAVSDYEVNLTASGEGINDINRTENVGDGDVYSVDLTVKTNYQTPIKINSITVGGTALSASDYSIIGTKLTLNSGIINSDCSVVISAEATNVKYTTYNVSPYIGANISLPADTVSYVSQGATYTLTLIPTTDYALPSTITVTMEDSSGTPKTLTVGSDYTYSTTTGVIEIPDAQGDITITVAAATGTVYHDVKHTLSYVTMVSGTEQGTEIVKDGTTYTATFAVTDAAKYYAITSSIVYVTVGGSNWSSSTNTTFDEETGKLTIENVTGDVVISISAEAIPSYHTLYFNLSYLYSDVVLESNDYKLTVDNGENKTVYLKVKDGYSDKFLPATVTVVNSRTNETLVQDTDYTYTISSDGYATLTLLTVSDSLKITATAGSTEADTDTDSDGGTDGDSDSDSDDDSDGSTASTYEITFVDSSGNTVTTLTTSTDKTLSYLPTISTTDSTVFLGWYTSSSGGTQITTSTVFTSSRTVYARVYTVFTPVYGTNGQHVITTSNSNISIYADSLSGGTITVSSNYVANFVIISPYSGYTTTASTIINLPDSNGNTVSWTIPAGVQIDSTNHLNLAISVSETAINTSTTLGRSLGYVDFAHSGALTANNQTLYVTFRNYNVTTGDNVQLFKLNDYNEMTGDYVSATALGNYYVRAGMVSCSRWEIISRNYTYNPDNGGYYTQYFNIPTTGYIEELRNVQIDQVLDLTKINLGNGIIIEGWYYDQSFTNRVSNPSYVVVTAAIIKTGLYPKTYSDYVTPDNGNPWPDSSNGYLPNLTDTPVTNTKILTQLF